MKKVERKHPAEMRDHRADGEVPTAHYAEIFPVYPPKSQIMGAILFVTGYSPSRRKQNQGQIVSVLYVC